MEEYKVQSVNVEDLRPGMILHSTAMTDTGRVVLRAGLMLNEGAIRGLKTWNISSVDIRIISQGEVPEPGAQPTSAPSDDEIERLLEEKASEVECVVEKASEVQAPAIEPEPEEGEYPAADLPERFVTGYQNALRQVKNELTKARFMKDNFSAENMEAIISEFVLPLLDDPGVFWKLQFVEHTEDYLYHHSVDVAIIAGCIGKWLGCSPEMQKRLMWGGLMHDIGKALVPLKIINKAGVLTTEEWNVAQLHAARGYKYLRKNFDIPREIYYCVLQHHERLDGSGYPLSLPGNKIDIGARVIAVADIFSAMTSARSYSRRSTSYDAAATLQTDMFGKLDSQICSLFLEKLRQCFHANRVRLSDGCEAEVVFLNNSDDSRPMVRTNSGEVIDLSQKRNLSIRRVLY